MQIIEGLTPNEPLVTNDKGGSQSFTPYGFELIPAKPIFALANIYKYGADKYGNHNYLKLPIDSQLGHAIQHIYAYLAGDSSDKHLEHALTRVTQALHTHYENGGEFSPQVYHKK